MGEIGTPANDNSVWLLEDDEEQYTDNRITQQLSQEFKSVYRTHVKTGRQTSARARTHIVYTHARLLELVIVLHLRDE